MCEFQRFTKDFYSICLYTKSLCTLCVLGNKSIYNKAKMAEEQKYETFENGR